MNNTISTKRMEASKIQDLQDLQVNKLDLLTLIDATAVSWEAYSQGHCSQDVSIQCRVDVDCGGGNTCDTTFAYTQRCKNLPSKQCCDNPFSTTCTSNFCSEAEGPCIFSDVQMFLLGNALNATLQSYPGVSESETKLNQIFEEAKTAYNTTELRQKMSETVSTLNGIDLDKFRSDIDLVEQELNRIGVSELRTNVQDLISSIDSLNLQSAYDQLDAMNSTFQEVQSQRSQLDDAKDLAGALRDLL